MSGKHKKKASKKSSEDELFRDPVQALRDGFGKGGVKVETLRELAQAVMESPRARYPLEEVYGNIVERYGPVCLKKGGLRCCVMAHLMDWLACEGMKMVVCEQLEKNPGCLQKLADALDVEGMRTRAL